MGSSGQLYSLSWGEFGSSLTSAVQLLRGHGDLVDVTLAAEGRSFLAHKIVLSAASPFLLDLLKETPCQHPVVMLAGISSDDLESLLEFVYHGQVSVEPSQLPSLLQAAHCLSIHGLSPPTILTEDGEQVPVSAIPETAVTEPIRKENEEMNSSSVPNNRRKKRRKSSSSSSKWQRMENVTNVTDSEDQQNISDERTTNIEEKNDNENPQEVAVIEEEDSNHRTGTSWAGNQSSASSTHENSQQDQILDLKQHLHSLLPFQQFSPLHIPSFSGSLSVGMPAGFPVMQASTSSGITTPSKIRGASDCPGQCSFCGATLRQARNLRRHILSSCKYRFNTHTTPQQLSDQMIVEIKPEIDMAGYMGQSYMTDSGGSNSCEPIVFKNTPLSSPNGSDVNSPHRNGPSPTVAR